MPTNIRALLQNAEFLTSAPGLAQCPDDNGVEVAFAGRSNAGKSSAINCLTQQTGLARTSKTPGRTQLLNFFKMSEHQRIVDLPGYGYAKVPPAVKEKWRKSMEHYLQERQSLFGLVLMMDIRHPMKEFDEMMLEWAEHYQMRIHVLLTKSDKLKKGPAKAALLKLEQTLSARPELFSAQIFSSLKRTGTDQAWQRLQSWFDEADTVLEEINEKQDSSASEPETEMDTDPNNN